jgi:hypothetical protein
MNCRLPRTQSQDAPQAKSRKHHQLALYRLSCNCPWELQQTLWSLFLGLPKGSPKTRTLCILNVWNILTIRKWYSNSTISNSISSPRKNLFNALSRFFLLKFILSLNLSLKWQGLILTYLCFGNVTSFYWNIVFIQQFKKNPNLDMVWSLDLDPKMWDTF